MATFIVIIKFNPSEILSLEIHRNMKDTQFWSSYYPIDGMKFLIYIHKTAIYSLFVLIPCKIPFLFLKHAELTKKIFSINSIYSGFSFVFLSIDINEIAFQKHLNVSLSLRFA